MEECTYRLSSLADSELPVKLSRISYCLKNTKALNVCPGLAVLRDVYKGAPAPSILSTFYPNASEHRDLQNLGPLFSAR